MNQIQKLEMIPLLNQVPKSNLLYPKNTVSFTEHATCSDSLEWFFRLSGSNLFGPNGHREDAPHFRHNFLSVKIIYAQNYDFVFFFIDDKNKNK